jgi:hypothetical protein
VDSVTDDVPDPLTQAAVTVAVEQIRALWQQINPCGWWVGPVWKTGGETCVCAEQAGHDMPHRCTCGAWFEGCGHPPGAPAPDRSKPA